MQTDVLIVGGGPVGLTLAMDLASRGVSVVLAERRHAAEAPRVKCNHISARSMETFRRLGVADTLRAAGLPADYPHDAAIRTTVVGHEMARIPIPSMAGRKQGVAGPDTWWPTPEPPHRINQHYMEPILFQHAMEFDGMTILDRTEIHIFNQFEDRVVAQANHLDSGHETTIKAQFLIGCDGGRSMVRKAIGAQFSGDAVIQRVQSTYISAPELLPMMKGGPAWGIMALNPRRSGTLYAIDGKDRWIVHNYLRPNETEFDDVDRDWAIRTILGVDERFEYEVLTYEDWFGRRLISDKFREGRVFLCGDSAHIWVPFGGYGMNAGIADATNLAWMLAAHINGWAPISILDAYEAERMPITEQVSVFAMNHAHEMIKNRKQVPADIEADENEELRQAYGAEMAAINVNQYCCAGLNFGYFYDQSPLIAYDDADQPGYSMGSFTESTVPGCRTPHFFTKSGISLYDILGQAYTLLRFDDSEDVTALIKEAQTQGVPVSVVDLSGEEVPEAYTTKLLISRPDRHIAWRGDRLPHDVAGLVKKLRGVT